MKTLYVGIFILLFASCDTMTENKNPLIISFNARIDFNNINPGHISQATDHVLLEADKIKNDIKKTALTVTHSLQGKFDNTTGKFNLFQLRSFLVELKDKYLKLYKQLSKEESPEE